MKAYCSKTFWCLLAVLLTVSYTLGIMLVNEGGNWPENWPKELEPLRAHATTGDFMAGAHATYYYIEFDDREQFESIWPYLLQLKSKGAPLTLLTIDPPKTDPNDNRRLHTKPTVVLVCPATGSYSKIPDGSYTHQAKWSKDIENQLDDGILPQFVGRNSDNTWTIITDPNNSDNLRKYGVLQQARLEITLYVDGNIIDLNRIRLPKDTPIKDHRKLNDKE